MVFLYIKKPMTSNVWFMMHSFIWTAQFFYLKIWYVRKPRQRCRHYQADQCTHLMVLTSNHMHAPMNSDKVVFPGDKQNNCNPKGFPLMHTMQILNIISWTLPIEQMIQMCTLVWYILAPNKSCREGWHLTLVEAQETPGMYRSTK